MPAAFSSAVTRFEPYAYPGLGVTVTSRAEHPRTVGPALHHGEVTDEQPADPCVFDRLLAAGLSLKRVEEHLTAGRVQLDGELVTDPYTPAPTGTRVTLWAD